ncbi:LysR family transcriptional regulator [Burkholderia ubonensis]|uniref:LysR family transcriptional regulator n=1 Tax=Burkholderia ubonensis TaxID=101571 RepID=UPI002ABE0D15|nr:LysR family transcriptional regulator [Burkholderia ubonensis]
MNYRDLDLNLLITLHALLETRSVSRAAEMLHIGQPACSGALARLRDHFGDDLLVPVNRRMVPTPLALQLQHPAREAIKRAEAIAATRAGFVPNFAMRRFSIICSDMVTKLVLTHVIRALELGAPNVSLMIHSASPLRSSRMLVEEALDRRGADFVVVPARYVPAGYASLPLLSTDYSCIVWSKNSLVHETITRDLFYSLKHIAPTFGDGRVMSVEDEDALRRRTFSAKSEYALSLPSMVVGTNLVATIPTLLARAYESQYDLRVFPVPIPVPMLEERLVWPKHLDGDPASLWLRKLIHSCATNSTLHVADG